MDGVHLFPVQLSELLLTDSTHCHQSFVNLSAESYQKHWCAIQTQKEQDRTCSHCMLIAPVTLHLCVVDVCH